MTIREEIDKLKNDMAHVSKISAELSRARFQKRDRIQRVIIVVLAALLLLTNALWMSYCSQFEKVVETTETVTTTYEDVSADADNGSNISFAGGDITYGG